MGGATRRVGLAAMILAAALLLLTVLTRPSTEQAPTGTAQPRSDSVQPLPTSTPTPNPFAVATDDETVTINRLWSPAPLVARAEGQTTTAGIIVAVLADGRSLPPVTLDADANGKFSVDIRGLEPGPQEVCVAGACQRVLVAEPFEEPQAVIEERIERSIAAASQRFDLDALIPGWTFVIAGANSSVGGSADPDTKTIMINSNSGRSASEYEITVLHEIGHAVDSTWMTDDSRAAFRALRQLDQTLPWGFVDGLVLGEDRWRDAGEDFAEMFVAWSLGSDYPIMTTATAAQPTETDLRAFCELINAASLNCAS